MKKVFGIMAAMLLILSVIPVIAVSSGTGLGITIITEDFPPNIWMCDSRVVSDDAVQPGRISEDGTTLVERINNYAFEGEQIKWNVLVMDKNGIEKISDVYATIGSSQGEGNDIEANCDIASEQPQTIPTSCNARIGEEHLSTFDPNTMRYYTCTFTVETPDSMYGEYFVTVEVEDLDGLQATFDENEYWFLNPTIAVKVDGDLTFDNVRPGTQSYSDTLLIGNDADEGSGVMMDMFISGTDFYDPESSGAKCPTTNQLTLNNFRYFATSGAYSTQNDLQNEAGSVYDPATVRNKDAEGYVNIQYGDHWDKTMYDEAEILQQAHVGAYYAANVLAPGAEMALTFRLALPEPCNGDFSSGQLYFWGEAI